MALPERNVPAVAVPGRYRQVGTSPHHGAPVAPIDECRDCGAAVLDQEVHDRFHFHIELDRSRGVYRG